MTSKKLSLLLGLGLLVSNTLVINIYAHDSNTGGGISYDPTKANIQGTVASIYNVAITAQPGSLTGDDDLADILINTNDVGRFKFAIKSTSPSANFLVNSTVKVPGESYPFKFYLSEQVAGAIHATVAADSGSNAFPSTSAAAVSLTNSYENNRWVFTHNSGESAANSVFDLKIKQTTIAPDSLMAGTYTNEVEVQLVDF